jgi:hypothetical protein
MTALQEGEVKMAVLLIKLGADVNLKVNETQ